MMLLFEIVASHASYTVAVSRFQQLFRVARAGKKGEREKEREEFSCDVLVVQMSIDNDEFYTRSRN